MVSINRQIAEFAVNLTYDDLPEAVVKETKRFVFDSIGCALGATQTHDAKIMRDVLKVLGGESQATVMGWGDRNNIVNTAFMNALLVRGMDYNDIYWEQDPSHPSDIIPASLAVGELEGSSGKELIVSIVLAYEFEQRLCEFAFPGIRERKWHHATLTQFVSPIAAGKLLGLNVDQMVHAVGISACHNFTPGKVTAGDLTMMKNTVDPMATRSGVMAALMAKHGYEGPEEIYEGKEGFFDTFSYTGIEFKPEILTEGLGDSFRIMRCGMKAFPTEALTHSFITGTLALVTEHDIKPHEIEELTVKTVARAVDILADPTKYDPQTRETADHSLPYVVAASIVDRMVTPEQFTPERIQDPNIRALLPKIKAVADPELEKQFPAKKPCDIIIKTTDGRTLTHHVEYPIGDPRLPIPPDQLDNKFNALAKSLFSSEKLAELKEAIWNLETFASTADFMQLTVGDLA